MSEACLLILGEPEGWTPICEACHYVGVTRPSSCLAKAALVQHRTGPTHRRAWHDAQAGA